MLIIQFIATENDEYFKPITGVITTAGGEITSQYCQLIVPANAVKKNTVITMATLKGHCSIDTKKIDVSVKLFVEVILL